MAGDALKEQTRIAREERSEKVEDLGECHCFARKSSQVRKVRLEGRKNPILDKKEGLESNDSEGKGTSIASRGGGLVEEKGTGTTMMVVEGGRGKQPFFFL